MRAGRVRLVLGPAGRRARLLLPRPRRTGRRPRRRHGGGPRGERDAEPRPGGVRRDGRRAVRVLHARTRRRGGRPPPAHSRSQRRRDPRGALREPLPVHRLREDPRGRASGLRPMTTTAQPGTRTLERGVATPAVRRSDATPKVTGEFAYSSDLHAAEMLWGKTVRSPHPHARILEIDVSEAVAMPGVHAVLTHEDVPGKKLYGLEFPDQPVLAIDCVRYFGEAVAIVAAEEPEQARRAAAAVRVEYEPLEPIADPERATEMPPLHVDWPFERHGPLVPLLKERGAANAASRTDSAKPNVVRELTIRRGDPELEGDVSVSGYYEIGQQDQAFLGPESGIAIPDGEGGVDIHVATQWLHVDRDQVAPCLGLQPEMVRIHLAGVGGAFGGREDLSIQIHAALLALHTSRPVKMVYSREESFVGHIHRHPARIWAEHRATKEGRLIAVRMRILLDGGAYASTTAIVLLNALSFACGPYR